MTNLIEQLAEYISNETDSLKTADSILEQIHEKVLDKLEDDYDF